MARAEVYTYTPSQTVNLMKYIGFSILSIVSIYFIFNQSIVDFIVSDSKFITLENLDSIVFGDFKQYFSYLFMAVLLYLLLSMLYSYLVIKTTLYIINPSNKTIKIKKGIIAKNIDVIQISKVKDIDVSISIIERIFKVGTLVIYTNGDMSDISDDLTVSERRKLQEVNNNVVTNFTSIRKMVSIGEPQFVLELIMGS